MKLNLKSVLALLVGAFSFLVGFTNVFAATLVQTPVDDYFYTRRGGGKPYMSAQWNLYDIDGKVAYCIEPGVNILFTITTVRLVISTHHTLMK